MIVIPNLPVPFVLVRLRHRPKGATGTRRCSTGGCPKRPLLIAIRAACLFHCRSGQRKALSRMPRALQDARAFGLPGATVKRPAGAELWQ